MGVGSREANLVVGSETCGYHELRGVNTEADNFNRFLRSLNGENQLTVIIAEVSC